LTKLKKRKPLHDKCHHKNVKKIKCKLEVFSARFLQINGYYALRREKKTKAQKKNGQKAYRDNIKEIK
jgi:hypothetical protein